MVALWMREGFAHYLLRGELARFDELATSLAERGQDGWAEFDEDPQLWAAFVHAHAPRPCRSPKFPPEAPPPPRPDNPPPFTLGDDNMRLEKRIVLLDRDGIQIAGHIERSALFERRPVCANNTFAGANLLGYIGLNAPMEQRDASDTFFLRGQYASLALAALIAIALSAAAAFIIARQLLEPIRRLEA